MPGRLSYSPILAMLPALLVLSCGKDSLTNQLQNVEDNVLAAAIRRVEPPSRPSQSLNGCPREMARIGAYCVDRWEAHLVRAVGSRQHVHPFNATLCSDTSFPAGLRKSRNEKGAFELACRTTLSSVRAVSSPGIFPQAYVSQNQAETACNNAGKRLCTKNEWKTACSGPAHHSYPYGDSYQAKKCNAKKPHVLGLFYGEIPSNWSYANFNDPRLNVQPGFLEKTMERKECSNEYGVYDMIGNVQEWVSDRIKWGHLKGRGVFMGSYYGNRGDESGVGCNYEINAHEPDYHDYSVGFRCCKDANRDSSGASPQRQALNK